MGTHLPGASSSAIDTSRFYVDSTEGDGIEYPTATGPIDILAVDPTGAFVVFERKRATSPDNAIAQLTRYMGWVKGTIARGRESEPTISVSGRIADALGDTLSKLISEAEQGREGGTDVVLNSRRALPLQDG